MRELRVAGVIAEFHGGLHATPKPAADDPVFLGIKNINDDGRLDLSIIHHIDESDFPRWKRSVTLQADDIGIYVGGTFTDAVMIRNGHLSVAKVPTMPGDICTGFVDGLDALGAGDVGYLVHGTTVGLPQNAGASGELATKVERDAGRW